VCGIGFLTGLLFPPERVPGEGVKVPCFYWLLSALPGQTTPAVWLLGKSLELLFANR